MSVVGPQAADLRTALVGNAFHQPGYVHDGSNPGMMGFVGPAGPTTSIHAPFGYGQDEDKYEGPTFPHAPTVVRPVPLGGVDQYHVASDPPISTKCTLKEKYEPCSVDHRTGYDRYGNLDYAEYTQRPGFYAPAGFGAYPAGGAPAGYGGGFGAGYGGGYAMPGHQAGYGYGGPHSALYGGAAFGGPGFGVGPYGGPYEGYGGYVPAPGAAPAAPAPAKDGK